MRAAYAARTPAPPVAHLVLVRRLAHMIDKAQSALFEQLRGEQLSSVAFVQDYLQLFFDGPGINVTNPLTVESAAEKITSWQSGFRDLLCAQIAKIVDAVEYHT